MDMLRHPSQGLKQNNIMFFFLGKYECKLSRNVSGSEVGKLYGDTQKQRSAKDGKCPDFDFFSLHRATGVTMTPSFRILSFPACFFWTETAISLTSPNQKKIGEQRGRFLIQALGNVTVNVFRC